ncbi:hypothetical protein HNY73_006851 [Argiope bruennichi]|uniref:Uncharacterized protein n=1 Tax=Argiope bruennichi TaxID=94029 RepID=A0A8T0FEW9_ARGBR|nr:hypothetical protein HNY73_006851 [Argiope bruennichi]
MTEIVQQSPQLSNSRESNVAFPAGASNPIQTSGAAELVINVQEATAHYNNDPHGSQLRMFGHQTSMVEREIDKIFTWQSKRLSFIDPTSRQSEASAHSVRQATSAASKYPRFLIKINDIIQNIKESKYYLLMKYILLALPISACYMGARYDCPISEVTPSMLQLIGVFTIFLILFRIATTFTRQLSRSIITMMEYASLGLSWSLVLALCIEMIPFYNLSPDFENTLSRNYCHKTFYYYTFYMNIVAVVIGCVALLLHTPCFKETTEIAYIRMAELAKFAGVLGSYQRIGSFKMPFRMWTVIHGKPGEDFSEVSVTATQETPTTTENIQAISDSNAVANPEDSPVVETLDTPPCIEKGKSGEHDSSTETVVSTSTDDFTTEAETEQFEFIPTDHSNAGLSEETFVPYPEESPVVATLDTPPCIEKETGEHVHSIETIVSNSTDGGSTKAETEPFEFIPTAPNDAGLPEQTSGESQNSEGSVRRRFRSLTDESTNSAVQDVKIKNAFDMKLFLFDLVASIVGLLMSILAIGFGAGNIGHCPADFTLPYIVAIMGLLGFLTVSYTLWKISRENFYSLNENERTVISQATWMFFILWVLELGQFSSLEISSDAAADNYCSRAFYTFTIIMNIFSPLGLFITAALLGLDSNTRASSPTLGDHGWMPFEDF